MDPIYLKSKEIDLKKYRKIKMIESGSFGSVYQVEEIETGQIYAAKIIKCNDDDEALNLFIEREVGIMTYVQHPTIIKLIGYSKKDFQEEYNLTIIMELAEQGSVYNLIKSIMNSNGPHNYTNTQRQIILFGVSYGMKCLHRHRVIHRDIKAGNILLNSDFHPIITDFGLSKILNVGDSNNQSKICGTYEYEAPELLQKKPSDQKVDVYSFGILMYEIITDSFAYPDFNNGKIPLPDFFNKVIYENYRPNLDNIKNDGLRKLVNQCLSNEPKERPTFNEIARILSNTNSNDYLLDDVDMDEFNLYVEDVINFVEPQEGLLHLIAILEEEKKLSSQQISAIKRNKEQQISNLNEENGQLKNDKEELERKNYLINLQKEEQISILNNKINRLNSKILSLQNESQQYLKHNSNIEKDNEEIANEQKLETKETSKNEKKPNTKKSEQNESIPKKKIKRKRKHKSNSKLLENMKISDFNSLPLKSKKSISMDLSNKTNTTNYQFFGIINELIVFLMDVINNTTERCIEIINDQDENILHKIKKKRIQLLSYSTNTIIQSELLKTHIFANIINKFDEFIVEIKYPSKYFQFNYDLVSDMINFRTIKTNLSIAIFVSSIFQNFSKFKNIRYINFDNNNDDNSNNSRFFFDLSGCSSLVQITIPSSVTSIRKKALFGCSSLKKSQFPLQ